MAQVSYGTITITDTTDKNIFIRYSANADGSSSTSEPTSNTKYVGIYCGTAQTEAEAMASSSGWTWSEYIGTDGISVRSVTEIYQLRNDSATPTKRPDGTALPTAVDTVNTWSLKIPPYITGGIYWTSTAVTMSGGTTPIYTTPVKDEGLTDANKNAAIANSIAQQTIEDSQGALGIARAMQQNFWWWGEDQTVDSSFTLPAGAYTSDIKKDAFKANPTGGYLVTRSDGIYLNNGRYVLMGLTGNALKFYRPGTTKLLSGTETIDAQLDSNGLTLSKGGIKVIPSGGAIGDNNSVYISSDNLGSKVASLVNDNNKTNWRAIIGSKFGVDSEGNLYANEAHISGTFTVKAGSESNIYTKDESDEKVQEEVEKVISVKETSGNIVHVEDASEYPALSLKVHITPIQDLHGYDHPWVGGAGKNKLQVTATSLTTQGVTFTVDDNGVIHTSGTATSDIDFYCGAYTSEGGTYSANGCASGGETDSTYWMFFGYMGADSGQGVNNKTIASGNRITARIYFKSGTNANNLTFKPMIRLASVSDATYEPYENICPISGWSSVDVYKRGKNLSEINETEATTSVRYIVNNANLPNSDYVISFELVNATYANGSAALLDLYDANNVNFAYPTPSQLRRVSDDAQMSSLSQPISGRFYYKVSAHSLKQIRLQFRSDGYGNWSGTIKNIQLEHGTEVTNYSPTITPTTTTVNLGRTVYGGTLDVVRGVLTVTHALVDLGTLDWEYSSGIFINYNTQVDLHTKERGGNAVCSIYQRSPAISASNMADYSVQIMGGASASNAWVKDSRYTSAAAFKTAMSGVQLVYELATPQTYTLTPTEVNTLLGENNVWADAGQVDLKYASMNSDMNALMSKSNADIEDASKTATNYLTFDETNGLDIGYTGKSEKVNIKADGMRIYDSTGSTEPVASFLSTGSTIGKVANGESRTVTGSKGMRFYKREGTKDVVLAHIGYDQGVDADGNTDTYAPYYTFGERNNGSAIGNYSIAEGHLTTASGPYSHAEGYKAIASGAGSHAEGYETIASKYGSHAEGSSTTASGYGSHAEGAGTTASGECSHAGGAYTVAGWHYQTAIGTYNDNKSKNLFEIGYGSDSEHLANVFEVDKSGNVVATGNITSAISACGASGTADIALSQSEKKIWLSTTRGTAGTYFYNYNGGVKCRKSGYVEISGCVYFTSGFTNNDIVHTVVKKNTTQIINAAHRLPASYDYYSVPPLVCEVSAGDILYLYAYNQTGARGYVRAATESWLTVKYL